MAPVCAVQVSSGSLGDRFNPFRDHASKRINAIAKASRVVQHPVVMIAVPPSQLFGRGLQSEKLRGHGGERKRQEFHFRSSALQFAVRIDCGQVELNSSASRLNCDSHNSCCVPPNLTCFVQFQKTSGEQLQRSGLEAHNPQLPCFGRVFGIPLRLALTVSESASGNADNPRAECSHPVRSAASFCTKQSPGDYRSSKKTQRYESGKVPLVFLRRNFTHARPRGVSVDIGILA